MRVFIALAVTILFSTGIAELHALTFKSGEKKSFTATSKIPNKSDLAALSAKSAMLHRTMNGLLNLNQKTLGSTRNTLITSQVYIVA